MLSGECTIRAYIHCTYVMPYVFVFYVDINEIKWRPGFLWLVPLFEKRVRNENTCVINKWCLFGIPASGLAPRSNALCVCCLLCAQFNRTHCTTFTYGIHDVANEVFAPDLQLKMTIELYEGKVNYAHAHNQNITENAMKNIHN